MSKKLFWPTLIIILALLSILLALTSSGWALRPYVLFLFVLICPGMATIRLLRVNDSLTELILAIALSLALGTLLAELLVLTKHWSPTLILAGLVGISLIGAVLQIRNTLKAEAPVRQ